MKPGLSFLIAARQCEIGELEQLAQTIEQVDVIGRFTHALQRERGMTNIFLASQGRLYGEQRHRQVAECQKIEQAVRAHFNLLDTDAACVRNGARLFSRIAVALHGLDTLDALRRRIDARDVTPRESTDHFVRLNAGLLAVVFEAADSAPDAEISRALIAMFNFLQGKEYAGQERALGAIAFTLGKIDASGQQDWRNLIESQESFFQVFADFADAGVRAVEQRSHNATVVAELERLRRVGAALGADSGMQDPHLNLSWFDCCTQRIDAMKLVEDRLADHLRQLCESKIAQARAELRDQEAIMDALLRKANATPPDAVAYYGPNLERSILGMVQEQSKRLQAMSDELDSVRAALNERKTIERAKGLLMAHRQLSEQDAYKMLRQMSMNQKRRLVDVAEAVLSMADVLHRPPR